MAYRLFKIYTTDNAMDAYVLVGFFESSGIPALFIQGNSALFDPAKPLENVGIKIFVDHARRAEAIQIFKDRFGAVGAPPYGGPIAIFSGQKSQMPTLVTDPRGEEHLQWDAGVYDPLAFAEADGRCAG